MPDAKVLKMAVAVLIAAMIIPMTSFAHQTGFSSHSYTKDVDVAGSERSGGSVNMYFHEVNGKYTINTTPVANQQQSTVTLDSSASTPIAQEVTFQADSAFLQDVTADGEELPGATNKGFWLYMNTNYVGLTGTADVTATLYSGSKKVASGSVTVGPGAPRTEYKLAFVTAADSYVFKKGETLKVTFNTTVSGSGAVVLSYDGADPYNSHLSLKASFIHDVTVATYDRNDIVTKEFEPNLPLKDSEGNRLRLIRIKGSASDSFSTGDISSIKISVKSPSGSTVLSNVKATINNDTSTPGTVGYIYDWEYPAGLSPGDGYEITVTVTDWSGNSFTQATTFTMAQYGVYVDAKASSVAGSIGDQVTLQFTVYNSGGGTDTVNLQASVFEAVPANDDWGVEFEGGGTTMELSLYAGQAKGVNLVVSVPETAEENDRCTVKLFAKSGSDERAQHSGYTTITAIPNIDISLTVDQTSKSTNAGTPVTYTLTARNSGTVADTFVIRVVGTVAADWDVDFSSDDVDLKENTNYSIAYDFSLDVGESADIKMTVTPPQNPTDENAAAQVVVEVFASSDETVKKRVETITTVPTAQSSNWVYFSLDSTTVKVKSASNGSFEYSTASFNLVIKNNAPYGVNVTLQNVKVQDHSGKVVSGWDVSFSTSHPYVAPASLTTVTMSVTPDGDTPADEENGYGVYITATNDFTGVSKDLTATVKVEKYYDIAVEGIPEDRIVMNSYDGYVFEIKIKNNGNTADKIRVESSYLEPSSGWKLTIDGPSGDMVAMGDTVVFTVTITPDQSVKNGEQVEGRLVFSYANGEETMEKTVITAQLELSMTDNLIHTTYSLSLHILIFVFMLGLVIYARNRWFK